MAYRAVNKEGKEVKKGDEIVDFRGDTAIFDSADQRGRNRVYVEHDGHTGEYFPTVFGLKIEEVETA